MTRRALPTAVVATLVSASVALTFLPWVGIGQSRRSSYRLLRDLDTLGVLRGPVAFAARLVWVCQPALASLALLLVVLGRHKLSGFVAVTVFLIAGCGSVMVQLAPVQVLLAARLALPTAALGVLSLGVQVSPSLLRRIRTPGPAEPGTARDSPT